MNVKEQKEERTLTMKRVAYLTIIALIALPLSVHAKMKYMTASHTYKMGDNDSRNDARHICFLEAKRTVLEKAGTYIQSYPKVKDLQLTEDEISSYSAALLEVETVDEKWENMSVTLTVKTKVDTSYIEKQLARIQKDTSVQNKIKSQQAKLAELERKVSSLQKQLASVDVVKAAPLRKERNVTFNRIDALKQMKIEIVEKVYRRTTDARKYVELGMTKQDVKSLLGEPDGRGRDRESWYYGRVKVSFNRGGLVKAVYLDSYGSPVPTQLK
jgi:hypothetical protein